jgi:hypothetical protein
VLHNYVGVFPFRGLFLKNSKIKKKSDFFPQTTNAKWPNYEQKGNRHSKDILLRAAAL